MSLKPAYGVFCDHCKGWLYRDGSCAFRTPEEADREALRQGWTVGRGGGHCCGCPESVRHANAVPKPRIRGTAALPASVQNEESETR